MGFLNQSLAQIRDLFASMTPAARITAALLLGVIGVSLAYLFQDYRGGSKEFLLNGEMLQPREADRMEAAIAKAGLSDYERQGNRILVPRGEKATYLAAVANDGALPANLDTLLLDETADLGMFVDRKTRDDRMKAARERLLSMVVRKMDGLEEAQVLYDVQEAKGPVERLVTATVSVRPAPGQELTPQRAKMIQMAVAYATAGLDPKKVAIFNLADGSQFDQSMAVAPESFEERYFQEKTRYERMMKANIEDLLKHIPGLRVQVTADLDETLTAESRQISSTGDPVAIREQSNETDNTSTQSEDRGRPGTTSQGPTRTPPEEAVAQNQDTEKVNTREAENLVPTTEELVTRSGLIPKHVRAAIAIPSDYLVSVWRELNPDAPADAAPSAADIKNITDENIMNIEGMVSQLFPREPQDAPYPNVKVTVFQSLTPEPVEPPTRMSEALMWAGRNSGALIMAGLAVVSLVMLRSMVRSIPMAEPNVILHAAARRGEASAETDRLEEQDRGDATKTGGAGAHAASTRSSGKEKSRPKLKLKKGPSLKDDLTEMVRDDPDAAAAILRSWISNAS